MERVDADELPYPSYGAVRLADQAQFDPLDMLTALAAELAAGTASWWRAYASSTWPSTVGQRCDASRDGHRGERHPGHRHPLPGPRPLLRQGDADAVVRAGLPGARRMPRGMYLSADSPTRSLRTARHGGEELLLVGGNGHPVGRHRKPPSELVADLTAWTERYFPGAERTHVWSAQDYQSHNYVPVRRQAAPGWRPDLPGHWLQQVGHDERHRGGPADLRRDPGRKHAVGEDVGHPGQQAGQRGHDGAGERGVGVAATQGWLAPNCTR